MSELGATVGSPFAEGSVQLTFQGKFLTLGAQLEMLDAANSLLLVERLSDVKSALDSTRIEGVYWLPRPNVDFKIAVSNTTDAPLSATVQIDGTNRNQLSQLTVQLAPRQTRLLDVRDDIVGQAPKKDGGIVVTHTGPRGAVRAHGHVWDASTGYSNNVVFANLLNQVTNRWEGGGVRFRANGQNLSSPVTVHNFGAQPSTVTGRVRYTLNDGTQGTREANPVTLQSGETRTVMANLPATIEPNVASAGLEVEYSTTPGSVAIAAQSVSQDENQVFRVLTLDPDMIPSATGTYPWRVSTTGSTLVYLKNTTNQIIEYHASLNFPGGTYSLGRAKLQPHETKTIDVRQIRDAALPDVTGTVIPSLVTGGQFMWSVQGIERKSIIGRAEFTDFSAGTSSTYACYNCCPDAFYTGWLLASLQNISYGSDTFIQAFEQYRNCYGTTTGTWEATVTAWENTPSSAASTTFVSLGKTKMTGLAITVVEMFATWSVLRNPINIYEQCDPYFEDFTTSIPVNIKPRITGMYPDNGDPSITGDNFPRGAIGTTFDLTLVGDFPGDTRFLLVEKNGQETEDITFSSTMFGTQNIRTKITISPNAQPGGSYQIFVNVDDQISNKVTFFVQVPTKARRDSEETLVLRDPTPGNIVDPSGQTIQTGICGAYRFFKYTLVDQNNIPIVQDNITVEETFDMIVEPPGGQTFFQSTIPNNAGLFYDCLALYGANSACLQQATVSTRRQTLSAKIGTQTYPLTPKYNLRLERKSDGSYVLTSTAEQ